MAEGEWDEIRPATSRHMVPTEHGVKISVTEKQGRLTITESLARDLNWTLGQFVSVALGKGKTLGKLRVAKSDKGYKISKTKKATNYHLMFRNPDNKIPEMESTKAQFTIDNFALIVKLPEKIEE